MDVKYFIYDANGYVGEGYLSESEANDINNRIDLISGLSDGLLRIYHTNDAGDQYATDYDITGNPV